MYRQSAVRSMVSTNCIGPDGRMSKSMTGSIKRDIAHLCADAPHKGDVSAADADDGDLSSIAGSARVSPQSHVASTSRPTQSSQATSADTRQAWPKLEIDDAQLTQSLMYLGSPQSASSSLSQNDIFGTAQNGLTASTSNTSPQLSNQLALNPIKPPSNASPRTTFSSLSAGPGWPTATLGGLAGPSGTSSSNASRQNRFQQQPSPLSAVSTLDSPNRDSGQPYSNTHISTILKAQATHQIPQFSPSVATHSTATLTPALASPQQQQTHLPAQQSPYNPFAILNQAYDFSYPSQNSKMLQTTPTTAADIVSAQIPIHSLPLSFSLPQLIRSWASQTYLVLTLLQT